VMLSLPAIAFGTYEIRHRLATATSINRTLLFAHIMWCFLFLCVNRGVIDGRISG
jgi:hypothetical protein